MSLAQVGTIFVLVAGRATVTFDTRAPTFQGFVVDSVQAGTRVATDGWGAYKGLVSGTTNSRCTSNTGSGRSWTALPPISLTPSAKGRCKQHGPWPQGLHLSQ